MRSVTPGPSPSDPREAGEAPSDATVVVQGLRKSFAARGSRRNEVLHGVDFSAVPGAVTTLLGTNGAGKSTTLACAQGLLKPDAGSVTLLGQEPWRAPADLRARVGVMLQDGGLPPAQRPLSYLKHVAGLYRKPAELDPLVELLGLAEFGSTPIRRLSGGQRQRVALASALVGDPEVLFLDEPSAGLDPQSRQVVFELIEDLRRQGRTVVLTTHLLEDAERLSDTVHILDRGRIVARGTIEELVRSDEPASLTVSFPGSQAPRWPAGLQALPLGDGRWRVPAVQSPGELAQLTAAWERQGVMPRTMELSRRSLEEVFLQVASETDAGGEQEEETRS